jgi:ORF6N domain-containing protein
MRPQKHMSKQIAVLAKHTESKIQLIRGVRVILDTDLAELYGVEVKRLNEQVKRNARRFPDDFVMRLSAEEAANLRSQIATSSSRHGGRRNLPNAFTEHGAIMAASVLNSERADDMSIFVVRAFVRMREALAANQQIMSKLTELEQRVESHDGSIQELIEAIRELMEPPPATNRRIGFSLSAGSTKDSAKSR